MVTHLNGSHNGQAKVAYLPCESDYPVIDVVAKPATPKWRDQYPLFTHNLSWQDSDGCNHSLTLRSDSITDLLSDLKMIKTGIRQAKAKAAESQPQEATQPERVVCKIHHVEMERRVSKRTGGHYHCHRLAGNELCFGREKK